MNINDKFDKLTDLLIEWSESGMFLSDLNYRLKEIKTEEITGWVCRTCQQSVEFGPDVTTSEEKECRCTGLAVTTTIHGECSNCGLYTGFCAMGHNKDKTCCSLQPTPGDEKPWLPNPGDGYYTIHPTYNVPIRLYWGNSKPTMGELALRQLGLIFKTQEEAMDKITSLLK